ncbi:MAG: PilN domain-containing protein [Gammaproteobacteria bacterium]|nr:PilN domain-containing protein [Gammaproteobacteria bacterium]
MTRVNLLPWRAGEQRRRRQRFLLALVLAFIIGIAIVYWASLMVSSAVSAQESRNDYLRHEVAKLNFKIRTINHLKDARKELVHRMRVIQGLQQSRPLEVHLFEQLATTVPSSVYLTSVVFRTNSNKRDESREVGTLSLKGVADSPAGVSNYMRTMAGSPWLSVPQLEVVRTRSEGETRRSDFSVTTRLLAPQNQDDKTGQESGS